MLMPGRIALTLTVSALLGCAVPSATSTATSTPSPNITGNWQIQGAPSSALGANILLQGALQSQGSQVTGTFRTTVLCGLAPLQTVTYTGTIDASGNLTLNSTTPPAVGVQLVVPASPTSTFSTGTIATTGTICNLALGSPAIGIEVAPVAGTFSGPVTTLPNTPTIPISGGNVTVTLTQSSTPNSDGQFPATGTLIFTGGGSCMQTVALTGTVSGLEVTLSSIDNPLTSSPHVSLVAAIVPNAPQLSAGYIFFGPSPCTTGFASTSSFSGTLTRQ